VSAVATRALRTSVLAALLVSAAASGASCSSAKPFDDDPFASRCKGKPDCDGDGYLAPADCNDEDAKINPEAYDFPDGIDNDCNGKADDPVTTCETIPQTAPGSPTDFARAADLCAQRSKTSAGAVFDPLVKAEWGFVKGYGPGQRLWQSATKPSQVNIVSAFGKNAPRVGATMFGMATGPWNAPDPRSTAPLDEVGFKLLDACADIPLKTEDCAVLSNGAPLGGVSVQDFAELRLWVRVPSNAQSLAFDFAFFSTEFNQFWNASLNDAFMVLAEGKNLYGTNVALDAMKRAVTVNNSLFQLCPPFPGPDGLSPEKLDALKPCVGTAGDASKNVFGTLEGTGYDGAAVGDGTVLGTNGKKYVYGAGTGWLRARVNVVPRDTIVLRLILHDTFDGYKDSAVLVDGFQWDPLPAAGVERPPPPR
jgi:hypothetical protein